MLRHIFDSAFCYDENAVYTRNVIQNQKAQERIPYFIEDVYNKKRMPFSLGYWPPEEYERLLVKNDSQECIMAKPISV